MKKILILANNDVGLYKFRKELIQELIKDGNNIYISLPYGNFVDELIKIGCKFINTEIDRRGINPITDFKLLLNYKSIVQKVKPDLIITYTIKPNIYGGLISRVKNIPYIVNITGLGTAFQGDGLLKKVIVNLYKISLGKVRYVFFENECNKQTFIDSNIIKEDLAVVMNGAGVNLEEYLLTPMPDDDKIRFLFIGRVMKEKGIEELFAVAKKIKSEYKNIEFDIVGPFEDNYKNIVEELQKEGIINYYGYQSDVKYFIKRCSCFVLPSYHEGMANTLLEAGAMGRPIITTDIYGCKEAIKDNGYVCKKKDKDSLYKQIKKYIELDVKLKANLGFNSRIHIETKFDRIKVVNKTLNYIYEVR